MTYDLVVAAHNEDLSWLREVKTTRTLVYSSGEATCLASDNVRVTRLENVGREAIKYLMYVLRYWGDFSDYAIFVQGRPFEHDASLKQKLADPQWSVAFAHLGHVETMEWGRHRDAGFGMPAFMHDQWAWEFFNRVYKGQLLPRVTWSHGAQFVVSKEVLHSRSYQFYVDLYQLISENLHAAPWACERLWKVLLGDSLPVLRSDFGEVGKALVYAHCSHSHRAMLDRFETTLRKVEPEVDLRLSNSDGGGDFDSLAYLEQQKQKIERIVDSLTATSDVIIWSDVDIVFNRPFIQRCMELLDGYDILFQAEHPFGRQINGGFFVARACKATRHLFETVGKISMSAGLNDQQIIQELLDTNFCGVRWGTLPLEFAAKSHGWPSPLAREVRLWHANCTTGAGCVERKLRMLKEVADTLVMPVSFDGV